MVRHFQVFPKKSKNMASWFQLWDAKNIGGSKPFQRFM